MNGQQKLDRTGWLKCDLHLHSGEDRYDILFYTAYDLIVRCAELNFDVISITNHVERTFCREWETYAVDRGMLLIPGVEACIGNKHVLILNADADAGKIRTFDDLRAYKNSRDVFVVAPHPFGWTPICLNRQAEEHADLFDGVEWHHFHTKWFNPNKKAEAFARRHEKPLLANSDCHHLCYLGETYSWIKADKTIPSVLSALRRGEIEIVSRPMGSLRAFNIHAILRFGQLRRGIKMLAPNLFFPGHPYPVPPDHFDVALADEKSQKRLKRHQPRSATSR
jgi:predicted metal-dependent phosphoesterase TrpH